MNSRRLQRKIQYWISGQSKDGVGGTLANEELLSSTWAKIDSLSDRAVKRFTDMGMSDLESAVTMKVRRRTDIDLNATNLFIKYKGDRYTIRGTSDVDIEKSFINMLLIKQRTGQTIPTTGAGSQGFPFTFN